uniref:E2F associated phosphoprotein n=1 Tax=Chrysemys picta bellii TaxID=8478 RepID=A0A8C3IRQ8_CHRPI
HVGEWGGSERKRLWTPEIDNSSPFNGSYYLGGRVQLCSHKFPRYTGGQEKKRHQQRRIPTNDELLYDPEEDDRDQEWVDSQRRGYQNIRRTQQQQSKPPAIPNSDAVLNCPACMTTLCFDCQRHESYKTQYRAMFVMNCSVNKEEVLKYKGPVNKKIKKGHKKMKHSNEITTVQANQEEEEVYHPVKCTECSTEVAVLDKDEVFHFFNVLASHC